MVKRVLKRRRTCFPETQTQKDTLIAPVIRSGQPVKEDLRSAMSHTSVDFLTNYTDEVISSGLGNVTHLLTFFQICGSRDVR